MKFIHRLMIATLGLMAAGAARPALSQADPRPATPNIIYILADDLGSVDDVKEFMHWACHSNIKINYRPITKRFFSFSHPRKVKYASS